MTMYIKDKLRNKATEGIKVTALVEYYLPQIIFVLL